MADERRRTTVRLLTAFVIGFVSLTLEIAYTRVVSFKLFYYYTYFVIGLALLGLGAASAVTALSARLRSIDTVRLVRVVGPLAAAVGLVGYVVVARLPTDVNLIWAGTTGEAVGQVARLFVLSTALTAVFFAVGLIIASLFVVEVRNVRRLYFWDLLGAALGCLVAVPLQATIGPPAMILAALVALAALAPIGAAVTDRRYAVAGAAVVLVAVGAFGAGQLKIRAARRSRSATPTPSPPGTGARCSASTPSSSATSTSCITTGCGARRSGATTARRRPPTASSPTVGRSRSPRPRPMSQMS